MEWGDILRSGNGVPISFRVYLMFASKRLPLSLELSRARNLKAPNQKGH